MSLPITIKSVRYYLITGQYAFSGDLVITRGAIYFFPDKDLEQERIDKAVKKYAQSKQPEPRTKYLAQLRKTGFWQEGDGGMALQKRLDEHIAWLKETQPAEMFSSSLPIPSRFIRDEIKNLSLSFMGALSFEAQSDNQDFKVGFFKKKLLRDALWEGGFITKI